MDGYIHFEKEVATKKTYPLIFSTEPGTRIPMILFYPLDNDEVPDYIQGLITYIDSLQIVLFMSKVM